LQPNQSQAVTYTLDYLERVRALAPEVRERSTHIEAARRIPDDIVDALTAAGQLRSCVPEEYGGAPIDLLTAMQAMEALAMGDASTAWVATILGGTLGIVLPAMTSEGEQMLFAGGPDLPLVGALVPTGQALQEGGGFRLNGRWSFASGSEHAAWFALGAFVMEDGKPRLNEAGGPDYRTFFCPASEVKVELNWQATGLRASESHDITVVDALVPEPLAAPFGRRLRSEPAFLYAYRGFGTGRLAAVILGIAAEATREFRELMLTKRSNMPGTPPLVDSQHAQICLGEAFATTVGACLLLHQSVQQILDLVAAGREPSLEERAQFRLAVAHAGGASVRAVDLVYDAAGTSATLASNRLDRLFRDAHTARAHTLLQQAGYGAGAKALLGFEPVPPLF
jgi:alkylation response protein AidB-like acyl-CoA dehydrogenase